MDTAQQSAKKYMSDIAARYPKKIGQLFAQYGINKPVTGENLFWALVKNRKTTMPVELYGIQNDVMNVDGNPEGKNKFIQGLNQVGKVLTGVNYVFGVVKQTADPAGTQAPEKKEEVKKIAGIPVPFLAGISIIAVLILILIILKNRS